MPNIQPYTSTVPSLLGSGRQSRHEARAHANQLAAIDRITDLKLKNAQSVSDVQQANVQVVATVGAYGLTQVAQVSQLVTQLALAAPAASGDLEYLRTLTTMQIGQVIAETTRLLSRP
ncbi:hypothetical protein HWD35_05830 [Tsukamurella tyrosinosolvens]|uniref:hypothetical protein n=1 Tax=Tsukamurella tyrosinosolvens TaxID=57704 RepID=UPI001CE196A3|nr:hypothetical protein [Tsukamurella tyrosinosolvens]MCA4994226.1 hypothetical protein [Tsukamurella tyrosinosolvens]